MTGNIARGGVAGAGSTLGHTPQPGLGGGGGLYIGAPASAYLDAFTAAKVINNTPSNIGGYVNILPAFAITGPSGLTAGTAGSFTVTALNADGIVNSTYSGTVHFSSSDPQAVLPADYTFTPADAGIHTFTATFKIAGSQFLAATDTVTGTISGRDTGIVVNPAAAIMFVVSGFPSPILQGEVGGFTVTAMDPYGNIATGYAGTVHFSSSDPRASLPGDYTFTAADHGVQTFVATLNTVGTQWLTATDILTPTITGIETGIVVHKKKGH